MGSNVKLYALSEPLTVEWQECGNACPQTIEFDLPEPLTPGAAVCHALFPDLDATVLEALGRLVDVWPSHDGSMGERGRFWEIHKNSAKGIPIIYLYESTHKTPRYAAVFDGGCEFNGVEFVERGGGPRKRCLPRVGHTDPAAVVAAINQVIRRVRDAE